MAFNYQPVNGNIILKRPEPETQTASGIVIPVTVKKNRLDAVVVAVATDSKYQVGDIVLCPNYEEVELDNQKVILCKEENLLAKKV